MRDAAATAATLPTVQSCLPTEEKSLQKVQHQGSKPSPVHLPDKTDIVRLLKQVAPVEDAHSPCKGALHLNIDKHLVTLLY